MAESKSAALPLGYAPTGAACRPTRARADHSGASSADQRRQAWRSDADGPGMPTMISTTRHLPSAVTAALPSGVQGYAIAAGGVASGETDDLPGAGRRHRLRAQARRRLRRPRWPKASTAISARTMVEAVLAEAGQVRDRRPRAAQPVGDREGARSRTAPSPRRRAGRRPIAPGRRRLERPRGAGANGAARSCRTRSTPPASKCGTRPPWRSASARC